MQMRIKILMLFFVGWATIASATTNEIAVSVTLKAQKGVTDIDRRSGTLLVQMAGQRYNVQTLATTTTNQFLTKGSVVTPGWAFMRCLSTNAGQKVNITFDGGATTSMVLEAKEPALFRCSPSALITNWTVSAGAGSVDFEFTVIED